MRLLLPGLVVVGSVELGAFGVHHVLGAVSPLVAAVLLGALAANLGVLPACARPGTRFAARRLLRVGIVLLGFQLGVQEVVGLGSAGLTFVLTVVAATFFGTRWLGARLGVSRPLSLLVASGFSICGASAVSAVAGVVEADEDDVACSIALVTLCGSLAIGLLPLLAGPLGLHGRAFGTWVGASVHDVAQVVAAASLDGQAAVQIAVVVKLSRVILLAPLVAALSLGRRLTGPPRESSVSEPALRRPPFMPVFVIGFVCAIVVRSSEVLPDQWLASLKALQTIVLAAALVGLGTGVRLAGMRRLGGRPLLLGLLSWLVVMIVSYAGVRLLGI